MMSLGDEITIPSPPAEVWPLLSGPALVASYIPGATLTAFRAYGVDPNPAIHGRHDPAANRMWPPSIACLFQRLAIGCRGKAVLRRDRTEQPIELVL
jgi:hypothetical protein